MAVPLKGSRLLQVAVMIWLSCVTSPAQTNAPIVLNVTVLSENGEFIAGLGRDNFSVTVDTLPQNIVSFNDREVPASVGILIDTSGSFSYGERQEGEVKECLKEGLERFIRLSHPANEYLVMNFNTSTTLLQDWTSDYSSITNSLDGLKFKGQTSLYDAVVNAIPRVKTGRNAKQVLLIVSDGMDNNSRHSVKQAREALKRSDVLAYGVGFFSKQNMQIMIDEGAGPLADLAGYSGGRAIFARNASRAVFNYLLEYLAAELRSQYQLVITQPETSGTEKWRKLRVKVARNDASGRPEKLLVRAKQGYYR